MASNPRTSGRLIVFVLLLAFSNARGAANEERTSGDLARARELFRIGRQRFYERRYREAVDAFKAGYDLSDRPDFLLNLAQAYERLDDLDAAIAACEEYLALPQARRVEYAREILSGLYRRRPPDLPPEPSIAEGHTPAAPGLEPPPPAYVSAIASSPIVPARQVRPIAKDPAGHALLFSGLAMAACGAALYGVSTRLDGSPASADTAQKYEQILADRQRADVMRPIGIALLSAGGAAMIAGVARFAWLGRHREGGPRLTWQIVLPGAGVSVRATF